MSRKNNGKPPKDASVEAAKRYAQKQLKLKQKAEQKAIADKQKKARQAEKKKVMAQQRLIAERENRERAERKQQRLQEKAEIARQKQIKRNAVYKKIKDALKNRSAGFDYYNRGILPRVHFAVNGDFTSVGAALATAGVNVGDVLH